MKDELIVTDINSKLDEGFQSLSALGLIIPYLDKDKLIILQAIELIEYGRN